MAQSKKILPLLGNEAVVLGALESGVGFVSTYSGTPASEIGNTFYRIKDIYNVRFEFSTNEIVALEAGIGAAYSGVKTLVAFKHFGLNVSMDAFIPLSYTWPRAGMVIVFADDPNCYSSAQSEQDSRIYKDLLHLPMLEPGTPQQAKDFTKLAFEISEKFEKPVVIRMVGRVSLQTGPVIKGKIKRPKTTGKFIKSRERFNTMPPDVLEQKRKLLKLKQPIRKYLQTKNINPIIYPRGYSKKSGIITSGIGFQYTKEAQVTLNSRLPVLRIDSIYPLPVEKINQFIKDKSKVLIIEEGEGVIEKEIKVLSKEINPKLRIFGKDLIEPVGELNPDKVTLVLSKFLGKKYSIKESSLKLTRRTPRFCPGCPYWSIFGAIKQAVNPEKVVFCGNIGCYMMGYFPPFEMTDTLLCMGDSISVAHGIKKVSKQKVIAFIGDSTFLHAGIPGVINACYNKSNPLIIVFDNNVVAMTGHQPRPTVKVENILSAAGVKNIEVLDPVTENEKLKQTIKQFLNKSEISAIVCRHPCLYANSLERKVGQSPFKL